MTAMIMSTEAAATLVPDDGTTCTEPVQCNDGWSAAGWAEAAREYHANRKRGQVEVEPVAKERVPVELLLLRVHGAEIVFEPGNLRLLRELHRRDHDGFLQVRAELEKQGLSRNQIMGAILPMNEPVVEALGHAVALAPRGRRGGVFQAVASVALELVRASAIKKTDAIDALMGIARALASNPSHLARCARIVRAAFEIGAKS